MKQDINLEEIDRQIRHALHQDGFDEILVGLSLGIMAFFFLNFRLSIALIAGCAIQIVLKPACRRQLTYPRLGFARLPKSDSKTGAWTIFFLAIVLVLIGLGLFFVTKISWLLPLYLTVILAGLTVAGTRGKPSIYDYFIIDLFLCSGCIGLVIVYLGQKPGLAAAIQGWILAVVLIPIGIIKLIRFLKKYPPHVKEVPNGIVT